MKYSLEPTEADSLESLAGGAAYSLDSKSFDGAKSVGSCLGYKESDSVAVTVCEAKEEAEAVVLAVEVVLVGKVLVKVVVKGVVFVKVVVLVKLGGKKQLMWLVGLWFLLMAVVVLVGPWCGYLGGLLFVLFMIGLGSFWFRVADGVFCVRCLMALELLVARGVAYLVVLCP